MLETNLCARVRVCTATPDWTFAVFSSCAYNNDLQKQSRIKLRMYEETTQPRRSCSYTFLFPSFVLMIVVSFDLVLLYISSFSPWVSRHAHFLTYPKATSRACITLLEEQMMEIEVRVPMWQRGCNYVVVVNSIHNKVTDELSRNSVSEEYSRCCRHHLSSNCDTANGVKNMTDSIDSVDSIPQEKDLHYILYIQESRVLWYGLIPLLYEASTSRSAVEILLASPQYCIPFHENRNCASSDTQRIRSTSLRENTESSTRSIAEISSSSSSSDSSNHIRKIRTFQLNTTMQQHLGLRNDKINTSTLPSRIKKKIVIWMQPPHSTKVESNHYYWTGALLRYENNLIRAQSMMGYISTLGGGYFLCHHFQTAITLAKYQQYLAILLNDPIMYYTCYIHMGYNYIYNGRFRTAQSILRQVQQEISTIIVQKKSRYSYPISSSNIISPNTEYDRVQNMCHSAQLFGRRMRHATRTTTKQSGEIKPPNATNRSNNYQCIPITTTLVTTTTSSKQQQEQSRHKSTIDNDHHSSNNHHHHDYSSNSSSKKKKTTMVQTIDNYQRLRVVQDQSKRDDFVISFSRAF
jgi:Domain of unknown function (DUF4807)